MKILGIETSTTLCGIAVIDDGKFLGEYSINVGNFHDEKLVMMISNLLSTIDIPMNQIDCISVSIGPGSFTGLRIGISVAKGLAISIDKPIVGIPTLDSLAYNYFEISRISLNGNVQVCPVLDAKRDEVYYAFYKYEDNKIIRYSDYSCDSLSIIKEKIICPTIFIGEAIRKVEDILGRDKNVIIFSRIQKNDPKSIAYLGYEKMLFSKPDCLDSLEPIYVKEFKPIIK